MTDEQIFENEIKCIIRRNECVCNGGSDCTKCDLLMDSEEIVKCYNRAIKNIDLTNRQKAENEELRERITYLEKSIDYSRKEYNQLLQKLQQAKSEAIKEFAEQLIRTADGDDEYGTVFVFNIDDLVKEMTEGEWKQR